MFGNVHAPCEEKLPTNRYCNCTAASIAGCKDSILLKGTSTFPPPEDASMQIIRHMHELFEV